MLPVTRTECFASWTWEPVKGLLLNTLSEMIPEPSHTLSVPWVLASEGWHNLWPCHFPLYLCSRLWLWSYLLLLGGKINKLNHLICAFCRQSGFRAGNGWSDSTQHLSGEQRGQSLSWLRYCNCTSSFNIQKSFSLSSPQGHFPVQYYWSRGNYQVWQK